ncbi:Pre-mRNA-splicing factor CLF1 [Rhodotorula toruloides]|nr:Pre-mRNA-splicing factor CLF1 [Rhodotorula toruloides]
MWSTRSPSTNTRSPLDLRLLQARATARNPVYHPSKPRRLPFSLSRFSSPSVDPTHLDPSTLDEHGPRCLERAQEGASAAVQITAEQLLREAADFQEKAAPKPKQRIEDFEELHGYRARKRQEFEEVIRRTRTNIQAWVKYAN